MTRVTLAADPASVGTARRLVRTACTEAGVDPERAVICVSELVTNALLHGAPPIQLEVAVSDRRLRVSVFDRGSGVVAPRQPVTETAATGRGLEIVAALSSSWSVTATEDGKVVWFELEAGGA